MNSDSLIITMLANQKQLIDHDKPAFYPFGVHDTFIG
jgi:hypothetical protein